MITTEHRAALEQLRVALRALAAEVEALDNDCVEVLEHGTVLDMDHWMRAIRTGNDMGDARQAVFSAVVGVASTAPGAPPTRGEGP